jgi:hypothetical protein
MKNRPIIFSGEMVRAILDGRKTQTRGPISLPRWAEACNEDYDFEMDGEPLWPHAISKKTGCMTSIECPYGEEGDHLWVREAFADVEGLDYMNPGNISETHKNMRWFKAGMHSCSRPDNMRGKWRPSIFMPRWASRIALEVLSIRVERLQDISAFDALQEGINLPVPSGCDVAPFPKDFGEWTEEKRECWIEGQARTTYLTRCTDAQDHVDAFHKLWDSIYASKGQGWETNPWVWAVEFKRITV